MTDQFRFVPSSETVNPFSLVSVDGTLSIDEPPMSDSEVIDALRYMVLTRIFDEKAIKLQRQGRFGTFASVRGQEASVMGAATALNPHRDWMVPQYRELPALVRHGLPIENFALYFMGHPAGGGIPDNVKVLPIQISLAAQLPHAVGLAWGLRKQGDDGVVITFFGDGASSEGDFHESLNLAGVTKAPVIFFLQNNGWAISTPRSAQSAARTLAERGPGYGVEGVLVDGNDLLAVHQVTAEAVAKARAGGGPTLIESLTWRAGAHNTADDPTKYLDVEEAEGWIERDPITRVEKYLRLRNAWDDDKDATLRADCEAEVARAIDVAFSTPPPTSDALFEHVYADPPQRIQAQRKEWAMNQENQS